MRYLLALCGVAFASPALAGLAPHGTTYTLDPAVTDRGAFEAELGFTRTAGTDPLPYILKYGVAEDLEFALLSEARDADSVTVLARWLTGGPGRWTLALAPRFTFATDGSSDHEASAALLAARPLGAGGVTLNLGASDGGRIDAAADYARPMTATLSAFLGVLHAREGGARTTGIGTGLVWRPSATRQLEVALRREDSAGVRQNLVLLGFTQRFGTD
jgi:hypothetical protein